MAMRFGRPTTTYHPPGGLVSLRPFRPEDLEILYQIDQACFPPGVAYSRQELLAFISQRHSETWVAIAGEEITGFLVANREPSASRRIGHIVTIDVVERWRRRGVGTVLMNAAEDWARAQQLQFVYLETAEYNLAAQAFYQKRGYVRLKRVRRYYANGAAAWVMIKALDKQPVDSPWPKG